MSTSRPATRAKNADQHPGRIILDGKKKRRTPDEREAEDTRTQQKKHEQEAARVRGIKRLANLIDDSVEAEQQQLTNASMPKPRTKSAPDMGNLVDSDVDLDEEPQVPVAKLSRSQKSSTRDAVRAARDVSGTPEPVVGDQPRANSLRQARSDDDDDGSQKRNQVTA